MDKPKNHINPMAYVIFGYILSAASVILFVTMVLTPMQSVSLTQYLSPALVATFSAAWTVPMPAKYKKFGEGQSIVLPSGIILFNIFLSQMGFDGIEIITTFIAMIAIFILTFFVMSHVYANNPAMNDHARNDDSE